MKLKTNIDPQVFVDSHGYIEQLWIHHDGETSHFLSALRQGGKTELMTDAAGVVQAVIRTGLAHFGKASTEESHFGGYYFAMQADGGIIHIVTKDGLIFIFQCSNEASAAQIKMETDTFISGCEIKGKYRSFFSSIFKQ